MTVKQLHAHTKKNTDLGTLYEWIFMVQKFYLNNKNCQAIVIQGISSEKRDIRDDNCQVHSRATEFY